MKKKPTYLLLIISMSILLIGVASGFLYSRVSQFRFSEIEIRPEALPVQAEVQRRMMGFFGKSLFGISLREIEASLREVPAIESVALHRVWPTKIAVEVKMRLAVAMVFHEGRLWTVSSEGARIEPLNYPVSLPLLKNFPTLGEVRSNNSLTKPFQEIFHFLERLKTQDSNFSFESQKISELRWNADKGFSVWSFENSLVADLGFEHFDRSWGMIDRVWLWSKQNGIPVSHLDASFQSRVIARAKGRLQNSQNELNLEQLVRRKDPEAAVR